MTTYRTGNAIGSADPRDLYDNAENLDELVNSQDKAEHPDRLGVPRKTWRGMEEEFDADQSRREDEFDTAQDGRQAQFAQLMISGGYEFLGDYAAGIELTAHKQVVREAGEFWRPAADTVLPYTTTGAGMPEGGAFVNIGDGLLRQDLVQPVATFNNVADMKGAGGLDVGRKVRTLGYYAPGDGGGNDYEIVAAGSGSNFGFLYEQLAGSGLEAKLLGGGITEDKTAYIPTDYATLQEAIDDLSKLRPTQGVTINLMIETGHSLTAPLVLHGGDYSHFKISSVDAEVTVADGSVYNIDFRLSNMSPVFFFVDGCNAPIINILLNLSGYPLKEAWGYVAANGSNLVILPGCGAIGAYAGVYAWVNSRVVCENCIFTHSKDNAITAWANSHIYARGADASHAELYGVRSVEGSSLNFYNGKATDCGRHAARLVDNSFMDVTGADLRNCETIAVYSRYACVVAAEGVNASNAGNIGIYSQSGSSVTAAESIVDGSATGYHATQGSSLSAPLSSAIGCTIAAICEQSSNLTVRFLQTGDSGTALEARFASNVDAVGIKGNGNNKGLVASSGATISADFAEIINCITNAVEADGATIVCRNSTLTGAGVTALRGVRGASLTATSSDMSSSSSGVFLLTGSYAKVDLSTINNCTGIAIESYDSQIGFRSGSATGCSQAIKSESSVINARLSDLTGSVGANTAVIAKGSRVNLTDAKCRKGVTDDPADVVSQSGSFVSVNGMEGGTSQAKNAIGAWGLFVG